MGWGRWAESKIVPQEEYRGFKPAPLDLLSFSNGLAKYVHPQYALPAQFSFYADSLLDQLFPAMACHSRTLSLAEAMDICQNPDHANKSPGYPWTLLGCSTKALAIAKHSDEFSKFPVHCVNATLKDEIRPVGKDARLFRMQSVHDYLLGLMLYQCQNDYIMDTKLDSPVFVKYVTPGFDLTRLYTALAKHGGHLYDADTNAWDASLNLCITEIVAHWRAKYLPECVLKKHVRYYCHMYNGYTLAGGWLYHLIGQPSGHVNTTVDNCLHNIVAMAYVAWNLQWSITQFLQNVLFYVCGDDLIWSDLSGLFTPLTVSKYYAQMGMHLEFSSLEPLRIEDCTFVGTTPVYVRGVLRYYGRLDKFRAAIHFTKKKFQPVDILAKFVSIAMLSFFSPEFASFRQLALDFVALTAKGDPAFLFDRSVNSYVNCLRDDFLYQLYDQWEAGELFFLLPQAVRKWCLKVLRPPF